MDKLCKILCTNIFNYFRNFQPSKSVIKIGRSGNNEIQINDLLVSKTHCTIQYDQLVNWTIRDGFFNKVNKNITEYVQSTNGTWLYLGQYTPIVDNMIFKCGPFIFECGLDETN